MMDTLQHFRAQEHTFVRKVMDWATKAKSQHKMKLTDFLDPREQFIVLSVGRQLTHVDIRLCGGYDKAERKRAIIAPNYHYLTDEQFELSLMQIRLSSTFQVLEHPNVLGSLLGMGIKREKFGDIIVFDDHAQVIVPQNIAPIVCLELTQVGKTHVRCTEVDWSHLQPTTETWSMYNRTVSSLRLDVLVAELIRLSRAKSSQMIRSGQVKVNWKVEDQPSMTVAEGDILSISGHGRYLFDEIDAVTKKEKYRIHIGKK